MKWMDTIGAEARSQIRNLNVMIYNDDLTVVKNFARFVGRLHAKLSDDATVVYRVLPTKKDALQLWELGKVFSFRDPSRVPLFDNPRWAGVGDMSGTWTWSRAYALSYPTRNRAARPRLTFGPGLGWFGDSLELARVSGGGEGGEGGEADEADDEDHDDEHEEDHEESDEGW